MANDDQTPQGMGATPPPPPGGMAPPPPPPGGVYPSRQPSTLPQPPAPGVPSAAPAYAQTAPPSARPPKKRKGWIIALIVVPLLVCGLGACIATFLIAGASGEKDKIAQSETHYAAAETAVGSAESAIESATAADAPDQVAAAIAEATKAVRTSRDEIASARTSAEQLKDSPGKTDYLESLAAATAALDGLENLVRYLDTASGMVSKVDEAGTITKKANSDLEDAIGLGNDSSYTKMRAKAVAAASGYAKATFLFEEADKLDPTAELAKAATYTRKRKQQSDVVIGMAEAGKAGRMSAYNSDIKKQAALGKAALAPGLPAILSDPNWAEDRVGALGKTLLVDAERADSLRKKALEELGYTR